MCIMSTSPFPDSHEGATRCRFLVRGCLLRRDDAADVQPVEVNRVRDGDLLGHRRTPVPAHAQHTRCSRRRLRAVSAIAKTI